MQMLEPRLDFGSIATNPTESVRPDLWPDHAWVPALGNQGDRLVDVAGGGSSQLTGGTWSGGALSFNGSSDTVSLPPTGLVAAKSIVAQFLGGGLVYVARNGFTDTRLYLTASVSSGVGATFVATDIANAGGAFDAPVVGAAVYDGANGTVYMDGSQVGSCATTGMVGTVMAGKEYLASYWGTSSWFNGHIYAALLYNRALTSSQITDLSADPLLPLRRAPQVSYFIAAGMAIPIILNLARRRRT